MRGHENGARWAATRDLPAGDADLPARDASPHGRSGPGTRLRTADPGRGFAAYASFWSPFLGFVLCPLVFHLVEPAQG